VDEDATGAVALLDQMVLHKKSRWPPGRGSDSLRPIEVVRCRPSRFSGLRHTVGLHVSVRRIAVGRNASIAVATGRVGLILFGVACLVLGIALSYRPESTRRMLAWLKARDEVTNGMARQDISQSNNAVALRDSNVIVPAGEVRQIMSEPAGVEGPTAEVRVLQVGNGQITSIA
jgi:hypothetical protein